MKLDASHALFASRSFRCAMTWTPRTGIDVVDLVDGPMNGWKHTHPSPRVAQGEAQGKQCHYRDSKRCVVGDAASHWIFFKIPNVKADGLLGFCGDFQSTEFGEYARRRRSLSHLGEIIL